MRVRVLAFARVAELLGAPRVQIDLPEGATTADVWPALQLRASALAALADSTRIALNGRVVVDALPLNDADEIALLPPVGGG